MGIYNAFYLKNVDILKSFKWIRACLEIKVVSLGNPTYTGTSLIVFSPHTVNTRVSTYINTMPSQRLKAPTLNYKETRYYQLPHLQINYEEYVSQTMCLPFASNDYCVDKTTGEMWFMKHQVVNSVVSNGGGTPTELEFNVYCSLKDVSLYGVIEESVAESVPLSSKLSYVSSILQSVSTVVPYVTPWQKLVDLSAHVALTLGFSRPISPPDRAVVSRVLTSTPYSSGEPDFSTKFSIDPAVSRSVEAFHPMRSPQDLDLYKHLRSFDWLASDLNCWPAHPQYGVMTDHYSPTRLLYFTSMFKYWSGSLKYRIEFVGNSLLRQNFAIIILPPGVPKQTSYTGTQKLETFIVEVCGRTVFEFSVPYLYTQSLQPTSTEIVSNVLNIPSTLLTRVQILPITLATGFTGTPSNIRHMVFVAAGDDYEVAVPDLTFFQSYMIEESRTVEILGERITNLKQLVNLPNVAYAQNFSFTDTQSQTIPVVPPPRDLPCYTARYPSMLEVVSACFVCATGSVRVKLRGFTSTKSIFSFLDYRYPVGVHAKNILNPFGQSIVNDTTDFECLLTDNHQFFDPNKHFLTPTHVSAEQYPLSISLFSRGAVTETTYGIVSGADDYMLSGFLFCPGLEALPGDVLI